MEKENRFPVGIFSVYVIFYAGQAMYNTYLNVFLRSVGYSIVEIGQLQSVATIMLVLFQPVWGIISDKSKSKNQIIGVLLLASAITALSYYMFQTALWLAVCVILFSITFIPALTLQDNYTLEHLSGKRWDFGNIRLGGTIGYSVSALIVGFFIGESYGSIFGVMAFFFAIAGIAYFLLPSVKGHRQKREKVSYLSILRDKQLICMLLFNITYSMGITFFFQFYPLYFTETLGASSSMLGTLTFALAMSEVPFFWFANKLEARFGAKKVMLFAGVATALRWLILFFVVNPYLAIAVNLLSGCGYVGFSYCLIKYINNKVAPSMKATAQSLNAILGTVFSKIIFIPLGGWLIGLIGFQSMLLVAFGVTVAGIIFFILGFKEHTKIVDTSE